MLTEADAELKAFQDVEQMRQCARDYAKAKARHDAILKHKTELLVYAGQEHFDGLLQCCEKDADEIACEAAEKASGLATRTELSLVAYEVAYIEAYGEALPALMATALARRNVA